MHLEEYDKSAVPETFAPADRWILGKLNRVIMNATAALDKYDFSRAKADIELFFWQDFCDNYLEIVKPRLYNEALRETDAYRSAQYTLYTCVYSILQLMAPFTPFIVEEIYQHSFREYERTESIHMTEWPTFDDALVDPKIIEAGDLAVNYIGQVRKAKSEKNVSLKTPVTLLQLPVESEEMLDQFRSDIKATTNSQRIIYGEEFSLDF
jgi:valyl-tRNA synthetase